MNTTPPDAGGSKSSRSAIAEGYMWATRITSIAIEMVAPGLGGMWLDERYDTNVWGTVGWILGPIVGIYHLIQIAVKEAGPDGSQSKREGKP